ncbi:hypothetical protein M422DRAFT_69428 [Sphaerobolus stellatus SS14]|uniref:Unplaced genomic scaffold SPHSTscaffold_95, whole genome shotgun sequence n=1 Tax=Sphaerobolus stellatus (strain SS14) TaxID=990650 RepID=A0A0C9V6Y5_SPHS4|nr:hypothetical protein M422DRAFT_69428 [Sphaerobolus stellatus SS14]
MSTTSKSASTVTQSNCKSVHGRYGFALLDGDVVLVQLLSCPSTRTYEANVYRHNFVSIFTYSHSQTFGSNLLEILEADENASTPGCLMEEDAVTVFVAQNIMSRYIWLKDRLVPRMGMQHSRTRSSSQRSSFLGHGLHRSSRSSRILT